MTGASFSSLPAEPHVAVVIRSAEPHMTIVVILPLGIPRGEYDGVDHVRVDIDHVPTSGLAARRRHGWDVLEPLAHEKPTTLLLLLLLLQLRGPRVRPRGVSDAEHQEEANGTPRRRSHGGWLGLAVQMTWRMGRLRLL